MSESKQEKHSFKTDFLYGLFVVIPIAATIWIVWVSIRLISGPISVLFGQNIHPAMSFFITLGLITLVGLLARNFLGKATLSYVEKIMSKIPMVNTIYKSIKQVVDAVSFKQKAMAAVLIEYPRKGLYAMGWITNEEPTGIVDVNGQDPIQGMVSVFVPTTPNPTSGYFLYVPKSELIPLDLSVEDSVRILMSAGVLQSQKGVRVSD